MQSLARVFAGMSDGLVAVYSLLDELPVEGETYLCSHTLNKTLFGLKDSDPRQRPYAVRSMALVGSGSQVSVRPDIRPDGTVGDALTPHFLSLSSPAVVLARPRRAGRRLPDSAGRAEAGAVPAAVLRRRHDDQPESVGRGGGVGAGRPQQHPAALPRRLLPALCQVLVSEALRLSDRHIHLTQSRAAHQC